jgi:hypothetical protein
VALFTKQKLSDAERQTWSAQLLEVSEAELSEFGELPTLGSTWEEHDTEFNRLYTFVYYPKYGILAGAEMHADGLRLSGFRIAKARFDTNYGGMILLADEVEDLPADMSPGAAYWIVNTGELDDDGRQIWGFQYLASSWKHLKNSLMARVKEWDLVNRRNQLNWSKFFNIAAFAILAIVTTIALWPIVGDVLLGAALGEAINIGGVATAALGSLGAAYAANKAWLGISRALADQFDTVVDDQFINAADQFNDGESVLVFVGNVLTERAEAPLDPPELAQGGGFGALLLAASAILILL